MIVAASPVWAWGDLGHKIVCEIAFPGAVVSESGRLRHGDGSHLRGDRAAGGRECWQYSLGYVTADVLRHFYGQTLENILPYL